MSNGVCIAFIRFISSSTHKSIFIFHAIFRLISVKLVKGYIDVIAISIKNSIANNHVLISFDTQPSSCIEDHIVLQSTAYTRRIAIKTNAIFAWQSMQPVVSNYQAILY
ncbi:hypothetical protein PMIT1312_00859 [Prochlorococcus marinus str. MIT 1312]|nr:hypothetical protein PMIT1312_00859 [Prochlorococcus marinus str. MIT 1312]